MRNLYTSASFFTNQRGNEQGANNSIRLTKRGGTLYARTRSPFGKRNELSMIDRRT